MTRKALMISSICILGISVTSFATAQTGDADGAADKRAEYAAKMIERLDTNADGSISQEEFMAVVEERFTAADGDKDGKVTRAEVRDAAMMQRAERMIGNLDKDEDGKISLAEAQDAAGERAAERFARSDADEDGFITIEEIQERMAERGKHGDKHGKQARSERRGGEHGKHARSERRGGKHGKHARSERRGGAVNSLFRADRNRDGEVTMIEVISVREKHFDTLDANNDGMIEASEIVERSGDGHGKKGHGKRHKD